MCLGGFTPARLSTVGPKSVKFTKEYSLPDAFFPADVAIWVESRLSWGLSNRFHINILCRAGRNRHDR